jgi:TrmH family RNA methyltransferase
MHPGLVDVVLVRPARATNVAAACRALKNMGLSRLRIVGPIDGLDQPEARALAYGAWDILDGALPAADLGDAVAGCTLVAGTSGRPDPAACTPRFFASEAGRLSAGGRVALVFGPEASGLSEDELALCHMRVHIPTDAAQPSLNLAQAVLVLAYEIRLSAETITAPAPAPRATAGELERTMSELRGALLGIGYLNPANPDVILAELRALLARAAPTPREVTLLRGLARQVRWAAERIARNRESG